MLTDHSRVAEYAGPGPARQGNGWRSSFQTGPFTGPSCLVLSGQSPTYLAGGHGSGGPWSMGEGSGGSWSGRGLLVMIRGRGWEAHGLERGVCRVAHGLLCSVKTMTDMNENIASLVLCTWSVIDTNNIQNPYIRS